MRIVISIMTGAAIIMCSSCINIQLRVKDKVTVDPNNALALMKEIVSVQPPRNYKNTDSLNKVADIISKKLGTYGYEPEYQNYVINQSEYKNVYAFYNDPGLPRLIIGAHYDVYGDQQGADDNASGVTGLLLLAKLLKEHNPEIPYCIEIVFYTLEEPPFFRSEFMGSYIHARSLSQQNIQVIGMICLEMIGYFSSDDNSQEYPTGIMKLFYPEKGNFIAVVGNYSSSKLIKYFKKVFQFQNIKVESLAAPSFIPGVDFSDHFNYWKFNYPGIMITDTSFYRNPHYHLESDTIETIDFDTLSDIVRGLYSACVNIDLSQSCLKILHNDFL